MLKLDYITNNQKTYQFRSDVSIRTKRFTH
jgi:hypothetical protein